jgi:hypothetical protein
MSFIAFLIEQQLNELKMGANDIARVTKNLSTKSKVGFEFECYVEPTQLKHYNPDNSNVYSIHDINNIDDLEEFFNIADVDREKMDETAYKWWTKFKKRQIEDEEMDPDVFTDNFGTNPFLAWLDESGVEFSEIIMDYDLEPVFGWSDKGKGLVYRGYADEDNDYELLHSVEQEIVALCGQQAISDVVDDSSLDNEAYGVEIITAPLPLNKALEAAEKILDWIDKKGSTNESCGCHINVSLDGNPDIDWLKFGLFIGERHALEAFKRTGNTYTNEQLPEITNQLIDQGARSEKKFDKLVQELNKGIKPDKYRTFNIGNYMANRGAAQRVEIRIAGGTDYHTEGTKIRSLAVKAVRMLSLAADPNASRKEYVKKVFALINKVESGEIGPASEIPASAGKEKGLKEFFARVNLPRQFSLRKSKDDITMPIIKFLFMSKYMNFKLPDNALRAIRQHLKELNYSADDFQMHILDNAAVVEYMLAPGKVPTAALVKYKAAANAEVRDMNTEFVSDDLLPTAKKLRLFK